MPAPAARDGRTVGGAGTPDPDQLLVLLAAAQDGFADLLADADPAAPVPACGTWTVTELALHLAGVHRWAAGMARGTDGDDGEPTSPREPAALRTFYREQADLLLATLRELGPDAPALTLNGPGPAVFWYRRQVLETLVHLHDLAGAVGAPHPLDDAALWSDAVDEVVTVMAPRQVRLGRTPPLGTPVALEAVDTGHRWVLGDDDGTGDAGTAAGAESAGATVAAPARVLALLLWGRTTADDPAVTVHGSRPAVDDLLGRRLTP